MEIPEWMQMIERLDAFVFDEQDRIAGVDLQTPQEAEPYYLVIPLASTDLVAGRSTRRRVEMPGMCALPLSELIAFWISRIPPNVLADAQREWERVQAAAAEAGVSLPAGELIYLSDWD